MSHHPIRQFLRHGTLPQMAVFEAAARLGSFTRAAQELHLAQPTVSGHIRKLAETAGAPLFEQVGKRVLLTTAGRALYASVGELFETLVRTEHALAAARGGGAQDGQLALAVGTAATFTSRLLVRFAADHPQVEVALRFCNRAQLCQRLEDGADDLYLFTNPPAHHRTTEPLRPNLLVLCAHRDHPLANCAGLPLERVLDEPWLLREEGSGTRMTAEGLFRQHGVPPRRRIVLSSNEAIKELARAGLGIALMPRDALNDEYRGGDLAVLDVAGFPLRQRWCCTLPAAKPLSAPARAFLELLRSDAHTGPRPLHPGSVQTMPQRAVQPRLRVA